MSPRSRYGHDTRHDTGSQAGWREAFARADLYTSLWMSFLLHLDCTSRYSQACSCPQLIHPTFQNAMPSLPCCCCCCCCCCALVFVHVQDFYSKECWAHHPPPYADFIDFKKQERAELEAERKKLVHV